MLQHTQPSLIFDTILEDGVIKIPELQKMQNQQIHVIVVFKETPPKKIYSLAGRLKKYANPALINKETDLAWSQISDD